ncbi:MAG: hypothetical protein ABI237_18975 [Ginsengibacter sp.]
MLTNGQIQSLFTFCENRKVQYYDVQVELVDHLSNAIEDEMKSNPKITFEEGLEKVYQSFGNKGFKPLVIEKQKMVKKKNWKLFWNIFKSKLRWPKILLFFALIAGMVTLFSIDVKLMKMIISVLLLSGLIVPFYELYLKVIVAKTGYKFIVVNFSPFISSVAYMLLVPGFLKIFTHKALFSLMPMNLFIPVISIFLSLYIVGIIAMCQTISSVKGLLYKMYPKHFFIV